MKVLSYTLIVILCLSMLVSCGGDGLSETSLGEASTVSQSESLDTASQSESDFVESESPSDKTLSTEAIIGTSQEVLSLSQFTQSENSQNLLVSENDGTKIYVIDTYEKFATVSDILDSTDSIEKEFFDDKLLIVTTFTAPSSGYTYKFFDATVSNKSIRMRFAIESEHGAVDTAIFEHLTVVAVKKSEVTGCDKYETEEIPLFYVFDVNLFDHPEASPVLCLSVEDTLSLKTFFDKLEWSEFDGEEPSGDYTICNDKYYRYNSESGVLVEISDKKTATLSDEDKAVIDKYLK